MENRETKKLSCPSGKEVEIKTYITPRERNILKNIFFKNMKLENDSGAPKISEMSGEVMIEAEEKTIDLMVISYDGNSENVLDRILNGTVEDYDFILDEVNKVTKGTFTTAK
jgi:hypothetical protein